tara:strand:- start:180 stop:356 length:177 start_codon:yes stop_codon:yes gene_type:complete
LTGLMILGLAVLAGGQIWAVTCSVTLPLLAGLAFLILLSWFLRRWKKRKKLDGLVCDV